MFIKEEQIRDSGALSFGVLPFCWLEDSMSENMKKKSARVCPWAQTVISFVFPYGFEGEGNLAAYARGRDYHLVIKERLEEILIKLKKESPSNRFVTFCDDAPFLEVLAAAFSGAGSLGKNGLITHPSYGSYVLLGEIITDALMDCPEKKEIKTCPDCARCLNACPTGAISLKDGIRVLNTSKCISAITQKKGTLSAEEERLLKKSPYIWGCDECIKACRSDGALPFKLNGWRPEERICSIDIEDIEGLSDKEFKKKYPERAFTYRGVKPLKRNLALKKESIE